MYRTPEGERTLKGAEAALFRDALGDLAHGICAFGEELGGYGVEVFDRLTIGQQLYLLDLIGHALLVEAVAPPPLTAAVEGAVATVFASARGCVGAEADADSQGDDDAGCLTWREKVLACFPADEWTDDDPLPDVHCRDVAEWNLLIECIENGILWDDDWAAEELFADEPPEVARRIKRELNIEDDYFVWVPHDPAEAELPAILERLRELTGRKFKLA